MNPCTLEWYPPLIVQDVPDALQPSDYNSKDGQVQILATTKQDSSLLDERRKARLVVLFYY